MQLSDLATYAFEKYQIPEEHKWDSFPGFSVLCHPATKQWLALLMRSRDPQTGMTTEKCDLRCGRLALSLVNHPYITNPVREKGGDWLGIDFNQNADPKIVFALFDAAYNLNKSVHADTTKSVHAETPKNVYSDTPIDFTNRPKPQTSLYVTPQKITEMKRLYDYFSFNRNAARNSNFYRQGKFMEDYEDDAPAKIVTTHYYPTYHELNIIELRAYFTWRTQLRRGNYQPTATSLAYIYIYELINCIGASSPEDSLQKMLTFEANYLQQFGNTNLNSNFKHWMFDFIVVNDLPKEYAIKYATDDMVYEQAIDVMLNHPDHTDDEIIAAFGKVLKKDFCKSPVVKKQGDKGKLYFAGAWRILKTELTHTLFGDQKLTNWTPLNNAIYYAAPDRPDFDYEIFPSLKYYHRSGKWTILHYDYNYYNKLMFKNFVNAVDFKLRQRFNTGSPLKESEAYRQFYELIDRAIHYYDEQSKPKITVNLSSLGQIREDSLVTRDNLLTDDDRADATTITATTNVETFHETSLPKTSAPKPSLPKTSTPSPAAEPAPVEIQILRALLDDTDATPIIKANHLMPTVVAEKINEMFYDQFADNIVDCDGTKIWVVEDYEDMLRSQI